MTVNIQELKAKMTYNNRFHKDVAESLGISRNTFRYKLQTGDFKISEIHKMMKYIPLSLQEVEQIFFQD